MRRGRASDQHRVDVGPHASGHLERDVDVPLVEDAGGGHERRIELAKALPQRLLRARSHGAQRVRERGDRVAGAARVETGGVRRQGREQGLAQPPVEEDVDAVALDLLRELLVGLAPGRALGVVGDAGRGAQQHQPADEIGPVEREPQAQPSPHRVPGVDGAALPLADRSGRLHEPEPGGDVDGHGVEVGRQVREDRVPRRCRLREPRYQDERHVRILA